VPRVLVTGAGGFIGASLARRLIRDGDDVHLLVHPGCDLWRLDGISDGASVYEGRLEDADTVRRVLARVNPERVFHLAAHGAYPAQRDVEQMIEANVMGTINILEAALSIGVDHFVQAGTSSEYGHKDHPPVETEALEPQGAYAVTKATAALYCCARGRATGARVCTLRLYSAFGPWEEPSRLMPTLALRGLEDGDLPQLVSPSVARDFVYIDDVVDAFLAAAEGAQEPGSVYNIGTGIQTTLGEVVEIARRVLRINREPIWSTMPDRDWDTTVWVANAGAAARDLGWRPKVDVESGFRRLVDWLNEPGLRAKYRARQEPPRS
jgi:nucleoside-diphosphate-sugar epimerase